MNQKRISPFAEFSIYLSQYVSILFSSTKSLLVSVFFPFVAAIITVWIAGENMFLHYDGTKSGMFVIVCAAIWGGLFNSIQTIVKERDNIKRDYAAGARIGAYMMSRTVVQLVMCAVQSVILTAAIPVIHIVYESEDVVRQYPDKPVDLLAYYLSVFLLMFAADAMGLFASSIVRKQETASVMAPYILIVQLIFSGILFAMDKGASKIVSYFMLSRWGMQALGSISNLNALQLRMEHESTELTTLVNNAVQTGQISENPFVHNEALFENEMSTVLIAWGIMLAFIIVFIVGATIFLHRVSKDKR
ncbi:MAG: ABC transporter permease [Clostridia bacterium]|nr:ABC transporter permease [Clostridia bacterium]